MSGDKTSSPELDSADYSVIASLIDFYLSKTTDEPHEFDSFVHRTGKKIDLLQSRSLEG